MDLLDIAIVKQLAGGGGGSGTDNYNDLSNLPKINDTTLSGNKSSSALGLQSEINSDSKLASDLVDDTNQDNKFVTSTEKNTWNGKQNAIDADHKLSSDLVDDANKTNKFVTSTEKNTWNNKQNAIDSDHKLSSSLVSFTTAEAAALASGIDSSKVEQIGTNQTNILYALGKTGKNLFEFTAEGLKQRWDSGTWNGNTFNSNFGVTIVVNDNKSIVVTGTPNTQTSLTLGIYDHTKYKGCVYSGGTSNVSTNTCISGVNNIGYDYGDGVTMTGDTDRAIQIAFFTGTNLNITFKPMICTAEDWAVGHDFAPYALPNYDLTRLESEDRASLAEVVDSGAKNKFQITQASTTGYTVNSDGTVTASGALSNSEFNMGNFLTGTLSNLVLSGCTGGSDSTYCLLFQYRISGGNVQAIRQYDDPVVINLTNVTWSALYVEVKSLSAGQTKVFKPMLCTKAAFGVSNKFVPYRPNYDLVQFMLPKSKTVNFTVTTANTHQLVEDLKIDIPSGYAIQITATAWRANSVTPSAVRIYASGLVDISDNTVVAYNDSPVSGQLGLSTTGVIKNVGNTTIQAYTTIKCSSTGTYKVTIFYNMVTGTPTN